MITLLDNSQTQNKHICNFVDDRGRVIGFNPYPYGKRIKYSIRNHDGHLLFSETDEPIEFLLVGMFVRFEDVAFTTSNDDDTINAINFTIVRDSNPEYRYSVHIEGQGGEYYCEDLGLTKEELQELFSQKNVQSAKNAVMRLAESIRYSAPAAVFEQARLVDNSMFFDDRGYFSPIKPMFPVVQMNISKSKKGVVRGMHWQKGDRSQKKMIRVISGAIMDVVMDLRKGSPTYQQVFKFELGAGKPQSLYVPAGFAHGFQALADDTVIMYAVDKEYSPENEMSMNPMSSVFGNDCFDYDTAIYSSKDKNAPLFFEISPDDYPNG